MFKVLINQRLSFLKFLRQLKLLLKKERERVSSNGGTKSKTINIPPIEK